MSDADNNRRTNKMRTIRTKVYKFDELSKAAKEYATDGDSEFNDSEELLESLKGLAIHFDCKLEDWNIDWSNSSYSSVKFYVPYDIEDWSESQLQERVESMGSYNKETLQGEGDCKFTGVCFDEDAADGLRKAYFEGERDMDKLLQSGFKTWFKAANSAYDYQFSLEGYTEECEANEYEFTKDGRRI